MARYFSSYYTSSTGASATAVEDGYVLAPRASGDSGNSVWGNGYGAVNYEIHTSLTNNDEIRMCKVKPSMHIHSIKLSTDAAINSDLTLNLGVYKVGTALHDGAVILEDALLAAFDADNTVTRAENWVDGGVLNGNLVDADLVVNPLWKVVDIAGGGSVYSSEPAEDWDLVFTVAAAPNLAAGGTLTFELGWVV